MAYLLGIDNGGTLMKAVIYDLEGKAIAGASAPVPLLTPAPFFTERDMEELWLINAKTIKAAVTKAGIDPASIKGISFSGHGKGLYLWGKDNKPAANGILSTDGRAASYPDQWAKNGVAKALFAKTCQQILPSQPVSLLAWFLDNRPEVLQNTRWIFGIKDYIRFRLTGEAFAELTDFSGSNLVNLHTRTYDDDILALLGLTAIREKLPPLLTSTDFSGGVTPQAAELTGLAPQTPCAAGLFDIDACAIAMNVTNEDTIAVIAGTWSINEFLSKTPIVNGSVMMNSIYCIPDYYLVEECSPTSASNLEWYIAHFLGDRAKAMAAKGESIYDVTNEMVASLSPQEQDVLFFPHIYGANYNPRAKACLIGMASHHTDAHFVRAVYEGIVFSHKIHLDKLLANRPSVATIRLAGGVCHSPVWVQMFADVFGLPVETIDNDELGCFGAALAAGVVAGVYDSLADGANKLVRFKNRVYPNPENFKIYQEKYRRYGAFFTAMEHLFVEEKEVV